MPADSSRSRHGSLLIQAGLVVLTLLVYAQTVRFGFVRLDDPAYVAENPHVLGGPTPANLAWAFTTTHRSNWHPLTWLSLMLDASLGASPAVFHGTNVALHVLNVLFLFQALLGMTGLPWRGAFVAALFAIHPLHVESVAWVTERKDVLSTLFWMLTLLAYARWAERKGAARYALVVGAFVLGLLSKPMLVSLPLVLLLLDLWPLDRLPIGRKRSTLLWEKAPLLLLAALSSAITLYAQARGGAVAALEPFPLGTRVANAVVAYAGYLGKMLWPRHLALPYPYDAQALTPLRVSASALVLVAISALAVFTARSRPYLLVGWLWYLITLAPVIGLVQVGTQSMADRYTYVPLIGPFIAVTWGVIDLAGARRGLRVALAAAAGAVVAVLTGLAFVQTGLWRSSSELFTHALRVTERNAVAHNVVGLELDDRGRLDEAIAHYRDAIHFSRNYVDADVNLAAALARSGRPDEATLYYAEALRVVPDHLLARKGMGLLLAQQGKDQEATLYLRGAVNADPEDVQSRNNLAAVLLRQGRLDEAETHLVQALRLDPENATAHTNLGILLVRRGKASEAVAHFEEVVRLHPQDERAQENLERARSLAR